MRMLNFNCYGSCIKGMWSLMHDWAIRALLSSVVWSCCHVFLIKRRTLLLYWSYFHLLFSTDWPGKTMPTPCLWTPFWFSRTASRTMRKYISTHHKLSSFGYSMIAAQIRQDTDRECEKRQTIKVLVTSNLRGKETHQYPNLISTHSYYVLRRINKMYHI